MAHSSAEIIELDSDDDESAKKKNKPRTCNTNCINFHCKSGVNVIEAPPISCFYYGVKDQKKKRRMICQECLEVSMKHQEQLTIAVKTSQPLFNFQFPDHTMEVEISDSDSDDEDRTEKQEETLSEENVKDLQQKFLAALDYIEANYDTEFQIDDAKSKLDDAFDTIIDENKKIEMEVISMMNHLDSLRNTLYADFRPNIRELDELHINVSDGTTEVYYPNKSAESAQHLMPNVATKKVTQVRKNTVPQVGQVIQIQQQPLSTIPQQQQKILVQQYQQNQQQQDSQPEILHEVEVRDNRLLVNLDLPPTGTFVKQHPVVDSIVFTMKHPVIPWIKGKVVGVNSTNPFQCRVKLLPKKYNGAIKNASGKQLAIATPCPVIIPVGTRVVAIFQDIVSTNYYSGVIAEPPKSLNKYRYLVFFDDGYAQYVLHKYIHVVCESSPRVYEDIPKDSQDFIKKYLESYPERPMVKLSPGQFLKTEWNGKWWLSKVVQVDASLVQIHFDADGRTEWIYRGSARLHPLYVELMKANARKQGHHAVNTSTRLLRFPHTNKSNLPYVEYTSLAQELDDTKSKQKQASSQVQQPQQQQLQQQPQAQTRAVAKKSTTKKQLVVENFSNDTTVTKSSHSIVYYETENKIQTKKFVPHKCGPKCVPSQTITPDDFKGYAPLSIPLLCGWNRELCKFSKGKKVIMYQAPCGVRLRNMTELHKYLRITKSSMSVDLFEFDHWVHCLAEFVLDKCFVNIKDLSYGVENVPIPCVNELDHTLPDTIVYSTQREPAEGVYLNTDPDFLCSCDCEDDCQDKEKCQCWQLTIQGAKLNKLSGPVGYEYKRLPDSVTTGIYECNSRCKCSVKTCLNRVVQHPLNLKLQVFKTAPRGWGIRCLNDIPRGSFICIYAGRLLTEQGANEGGKNYGDEYLAELDYVEVVEGMKEDYESDVVEPDGMIDDNSNDTNDLDNASDEEEEFKSNANDSDEDFQINEFVDKPLLVDDSESIRKRLRKRKKGKKDDDKDKHDNNTNDVNKSNGNKELDSMINDEDDTKQREPSRFDPSLEPENIETRKFKSVRKYFGEDETVYIMDAKSTGNIGRYLNHSCDPNVFVQNVFVDTHDVRFPWVAFFALNYIRAGQELTWNYSYDVGSIPGKVIICKCGASNCRGRLL